MSSKARGRVQEKERIKGRRKLKGRRRRGRERTENQDVGTGPTLLGWIQLQCRADSDDGDRLGTG